MCLRLMQLLPFTLLFSQDQRQEMEEFDRRIGFMSPKIDVDDLRRNLETLEAAVGKLRMHSFSQVSMTLLHSVNFSSQALTY